MKEHSGGTPNIGYEIPIAAWDEESYPVAIEQFKFHELDKPADLIRDAVKEGRDIGPLLHNLADRLSEQRASAMLIAVFIFIKDHDNPKLTIDRIIWALGLATCGGASCAEMAREHGISKQAFVQGAHRIVDAIGLRKSRNMRDPKARENMRQSYIKNHQGHD